MSSRSRSLFRGASKLTSTITLRPISSFNKIPPAENKGPGASEQALPIGPFYEAILNKQQAIPEVKPEEPPSTSQKAPRASKKSNASAQADTGAVDNPATPAPSPSAEPATAQEKAKIIFGTRLAGPVERSERLKAIKERSTRIAGVLVPPKPEEPDNCCMSGCVNCVWDLFRDEMEGWASASAKAEKRLEQQREQSGYSVVKVQEGLNGPGAVGPSAVNDAMSMDDDGGGSDTNWTVKDLEQAKIKKDFWNEELYKGVPVGIREFMKTEKKLKTRHNKEGSVGL